MYKWYPDPYVPSDCMKYSICNNFDHYPTELAHWALEEMWFNFKFSKYTMERKAVDRDEEIYQLCPSKEEVIYNL
ncbi:unnamed protein product, partial [Brenthis ino]